MAVNYKVTVDNTSASKTFDLTSVDINPSAAPTSTPRQGGFTLRNRINFTNVSAANRKLATFTGGTAATSGNLLRVLQVPERVLIKDVQIFAVKGETVPGSVLVGTAGGFHASHLTTLAIGIGVEQRSKPESSSSYSAIAHLDMQLTAQDGMGAGAPFGEIALDKAGDSGVGCTFTAGQVEAVDTSMTEPNLARVVTEVAGTGSAIYHAAPQYFPMGGYVYLGCTNVNGGSASDASASKINSDYLTLTGTWEIQADCTYVPE